MDLCFEGDEGTKWWEADEVVEFEQVSTPVDIVLMAYECGLAVDVVVVAI